MKWRSGLLWILGVVIVALMAYQYRDAFSDALRSLSASEVAAWLLLTLALRILLAYGFAISVRHAGGDISLHDAFLLGWVRSFFNQILPLSGTAANAIYLRRVMKLDWGQIGSLGTPQFIIALQATFFVAALALAGVAPILGWPAGLSAVIVLAAAIVLARFGVEHILRAVTWMLPAVGKRFRVDPVMISEFSGRVRHLLLGVFCFSAVLRFFRLLVLFHALEIDLSRTSIFFISAMGELSVVIQLTPGGLGLRELIILGVGVVLSGRVDELAAVALVERALTVGVVLAFGLASSFIFRRRDRSRIESEASRLDQK